MSYTICDWCHNAMWFIGVPYAHRLATSEEAAGTKTLQKRTPIRKICLQTAKSGAGEQLLLKDCRARAPTKGVFLSNTYHMYTYIYIYSIAYYVYIYIYNYTILHNIIVLLLADTGTNRLNILEEAAQVMAQKTSRI